MRLKRNQRCTMDRVKRGDYRQKKVREDGKHGKSKRKLGKTDDYGKEM